MRETIGLTKPSNDGLRRMACAMGAIILSVGCGGTAFPSQEHADDAAPTQHASSTEEAGADTSIAPMIDSSVAGEGGDSVVPEAPTCNELRVGCACPREGDEAACCMPGVHCFGVVGSGKFLYCSGGVWEEALDGPCFPSFRPADSGPDGRDAPEQPDAQSGEN
jgi:hypothetical protein